ncbi:hypothetical protein [Paenibacillus sp. UMB4589-SE434]|uniref:hypothetical protein n=1 Tax=Paenibacillus sp. UMB4589-SE434 TaxID=3046314 RepID=UPI00254F1529|nr:hypothetical protein [Paenibacillus sp. UMB4589-SE434]MDK8180159.1 hypothetical protein [Paenibacillus sp. UMB4589-SE434]
MITLIIENRTKEVSREVYGIDVDIAVDPRSGCLFVRFMSSLVLQDNMEKP